MKIGERIKELRELRGLTLEQIGSFVGVNKATIQRYETGEIDIKRSTAIKLGEILSVTPAYIMGWSDAPHGEAQKSDPLPVNAPNADEQHFLDLYRGLNPQGRAYIVRQLEFASTQPEYQNPVFIDRAE